MQSRGKVAKINKVIGYGFVSTPKDGDVFFNIDTTYSGTSFEELSVNDVVKVDFVETERGLYANSIVMEDAAQRATALTG